MKYLIIVLTLITLSAHGASILFEWTAPTERTDGTPLNGDLAGFKIYYGSTSGMYTTNIDINDPLITTHALLNAPVGNYYSAITAYDTNGLESDYSLEAAVIVEQAPPKSPLGFSAVVIP
jgi:hypothetical protein